MRQKDYVRLEKIKRYYEKGITLAEIGRLFPKKDGTPISRQRVHQILTGYRSPYYFSQEYRDRKKTWNKNYQLKKRSEKINKQ